MTAKEFKNVFIYMINRWNIDECAIVFNESYYNKDTWQFSLGEHIWNKWTNTHNVYTDPIMHFMLDDIDTNCLQKLINRSKEIYG